MGSFICLVVVFVLLVGIAAFLAAFGDGFDDFD